ncbi:MAG: hypothetical protein GX447_01505 [Elusimicrobia bacterium]|nr:hypothetical protein [Elusimicrobiota bacterium]
MKKILLVICLFSSISFGGEITAGSVPGTINYQGRIERDNAPITGIVHMKFRFYNALTGGILRWESPEITAQATGGIFSATFSPDYTKFAAGETMYLEVQIESEVLSPREPVNSVIYAMIAKKLEDGSNLSVSTFQVTNSMAIGAVPAGDKLLVNGTIRVIGGGQVCFPDNTCFTSAGVGTAVGGITSISDANIIADDDQNGSGQILFRTNNSDKMVILNNGNVGINIPNPTSLLHVNGNTNIVGNLTLGGVLNAGTFPGASGENIQAGVTNDVISFNSGGAERMRVHSNTNVGIHTNAPTQPLEVSGNAYATSGIRGGNVQLGNYSGQNSNEISVSAGNLLLQYTNSSSRVGVGTASPSEKLHVAGTIKSDFGINASTVNITGDSFFLGNLNANGFGKQVTLSSTTIYGRLQVYGPVASFLGDPAYLASTQTFTGLNTFANEILVSTSAVLTGKVGVGISDFNFPGDRYLQVGDNNIGFTDSNLYMVSGAASNSKINFYRGTNKASSIETAGDGTLAFYTNNQKAIIDNSNFKIYNSALIVSPSANDSAPSLYVNQSNGNVGVNTVTTPHSLTVAGNIKLSGAGTAIIFDNGSTLSDANLGSAASLSNPSDALVWGDSDGNGSGKVILKAGPNTGLTVNSNGDIGVGTVNPGAKFNLIGGDMVLGSASNPYAGNSKEDLIVSGNIVVDGGIEQRSATPVQFSAMTVSGNVYLSTATGSRTGIGTNTPGASYRLDINGNTNTSGYLNADALYTNGTQRISNTGTVSNATWNGNTIAVQYGGTGAATFTNGGILYGNGTGAIQAFPVLTNGQILIGDGSGAPTVGTITGTSDQVIVTNGAGSITLSLPQSINTTNSPSFAGLTLGTPLAVGSGGTGATSLTGVIKGNGTGAFTTMTGTTNRVTRWSDNNTIAASSILTDNGTSLAVAGPLTVTGNSSITGTLNVSSVFGASSLTASSATLTANGAAQYSLETSSGIYLANGRIRINAGALIDLNNSGRIININDPLNAQEAATKAYVDAQVVSGVGQVWGRSGNNVGASDWLGSTNAQDIVIKRNNTTIVTVGASGISVTGDISVTGNVDGVDVSAHASATTAHSATNLNTANRIVMRDGSGNFSAGTITANLSGNVTGDVTGNVSGNAGTATALAANGSNCSAGNSPLGVDASGNAEGCYDVATQAELNTHTSATSAHGATNANTASTIVMRDGSGNFSAGTITANLSGNASSATTATTATNVSGGTVSGATIRLISRTRASLNGTTPGAVGEMYYCNDCVPPKLVISTGTALAQFSDAMGANW